MTERGANRHIKSVAALVALLGLVAALAGLLTFRSAAGVGEILSRTDFAPLWGIGLDNPGKQNPALNRFESLVKVDFAALGWSGQGQENQSETVGRAELADSEPMLLDPVVPGSPLTSEMGAEKPNRSYPDDLQRTDKATVSAKNAFTLMKVRYNLVGTSGPADGFKVRKPFVINGTAHGEIELWIAGETRIFVNAGELSALLADGGFKDAISARKDVDHTSLIGLNEIRDAGIDVRYDPVRDRLILNN